MVKFAISTGYQEQSKALNVGRRIAWTVCGGTPEQIEEAAQAFLSDHGGITNHLLSKLGWNDFANGIQKYYLGNISGLLAFLGEARVSDQDAQSDEADALMRSFLEV